MFSHIARSIVCSVVFSTALLPQAPQAAPAQPAPGRGRGGAQADPWAGKKRLLIVADSGWASVDKPNAPRASGASIVAVPLSSDCRPK